MTRNIKIVVEYDGSGYVGWQRQKNGVSVQERVEEALSRHLGHEVTVAAAGRTDSGVHALGQVVNFRTSSALSPTAILRGSLPLLPRDIAFLSAEEVPATFDARRSARLRWYRYFVCNRSVAPAVGAQFLSHVPYPLDWDQMEEAAAALEGDHDFSAFRAVTCRAVRTHLTMQRPALTRLERDIIQMDFRCQSFLQNQVRIMAGAIVACGRGKMGLQQLQKMLETGKRQNEAVTLPPNGLFLYKVCYETDPETQDEE